MQGADTCPNCRQRMPEKDCKIVIDSWTLMRGRRNGFRNNERCCGFNGIECNEGGFVTKIRWIDQELSGSIPEILGLLSYLTHLYVF